jgi:hypothetical protein
MPLYSAKLPALLSVWHSCAIMPVQSPRGISMSRYASRYALVAAALIVLVPASPCFAVDAKQKMATCKFGADDQKLQGAARNAFLKKCMANRNDPRGPARPGAMAAPKQ